MNLSQARNVLEKIITLYKSMSVGDGQVSSIERDLMLSYIRQLYEVFLAEGGKIDVKMPEAPVMKAESPKVEKAAPKVEEPPVVKPAPKAEPTPITVEFEPPTEPVRQVVVEQKPQPPVEPATVPEPVKAEAPATPKRQVAISEELIVLFDSGKIKELSEKLSVTPIADIKKAIGLNDRLLYTNELFGGDGSLFDETLKTLNHLSSFEDARDHLVESLASRYNWASESRKKSAKEFIKLVRRRFIQA